MISSAYCSSDPMATPRERVEIATLNSFSFLKMKKLVVSPSIVALSAKITSLTDFVCTRSISALMFRSDGPMPSIGEMIPPNTW